MRRQPTAAFPEACATRHSHGRGAASIHKSWPSPRAQRYCLVRCPALLASGPGRLSYRPDRAARCLRAATDQQATEKGRGPPPAKLPAAPVLAQVFARKQMEPQGVPHSLRPPVPRFGQRGPYRHNRRLRKISLPLPELQSGRARCGSWDRFG